MTSRRFGRLPLRSGLLAVLLLTACKELPDIKPFATATEQLKATVSKGEAAADALFSDYLEDPGTSKKTKNTLGKDIAALHAAWVTTDQGLAALVDYSAALAEVAAAGQHGDVAVKNVFDALDGLLSVVPVGTVPNLGGASAVAQVIGKAVIEAKAAKDLRDATAAANVAVGAAAKVLSFNLSEMAKLVHTIGRNFETIGIGEQYAWLTNYHTALLANERHQAVLLTAITNLGQAEQQACDSALADNLSATEGVPPPSVINTCNPAGGAPASAFLSRRDALRKDAVVYLQSVDPVFLSDTTFEAAARRASALNAATLRTAQLNNAELLRIEPQYSKVTTQMQDIHSTTDNTAAVFAAASRAATAMARAHDSLVKSLAADYTHFSFQEFASFVQDAVDAYKKGVQ